MLFETGRIKEWCRRRKISLNWALSVVCPTLPENSRQGNQANPGDFPLPKLLESSLLGVEIVKLNF